jgi:hypothetical protein
MMVTRRGWRSWRRPPLGSIRVEAELSLGLLEREAGLALLALEDGHGVAIVGAVLEELDDRLPA